MKTLQTDSQYVNSVFSYADPRTGLLSPGDARRLLHHHGKTWEEYTDARPTGSRHPAHLLRFLGYTIVD
jgi:hypothetical protein